MLEWENHFRTALLAAGLQIFGPLLQQRNDQIDQTFQTRPGQRLTGRRPLTIATLFGEVAVVRDCYLSGTEGYCPADAALGLEGSATPALARLICRAAAEQPYGAASRDLAECGAIVVDERQIQRAVQRIGPAVEPWLETLPASTTPVPTFYISCDGAGKPMRAEEPVGRKRPDGSARTREVKLGAIFTLHRTDPKGHPVRDYTSTTYIASYTPASEFALDLRAEARRRGVGAAHQVIFLSDGAAWAEDIAQSCFAGAVSILDFFHACQRVHQLAKALGGPDSEKRAGRWIKLLLQDRIAKLITQAEQVQALGSSEPEQVEEHLGFLKRHQSRMMYGTYRRHGWFIGSGVVEAGCKNVIGKRVKQSGMFWSESGATAVLNFRTFLLSGRFDQFWTARANSHSARNDTLALSA